MFSIKFDAHGNVFCVFGEKWLACANRWIEFAAYVYYAMLVFNRMKMIHDNTSNKYFYWYNTTKLFQLAGTVLYSQKDTDQEILTLRVQSSCDFVNAIVMGIKVRKRFYPSSL